MLTLLGIDGAKAVVAHFVHEAVEQDLGATLIDTELARRGVVIVFLDVLALLCAAANTNHPQELVDVCNEENSGLDKSHRGFSIDIPHLQCKKICVLSKVRRGQEMRKCAKPLKT